ncbi:hypothetical protein E3N88_42115 [Mikania micrantha]|uniref:UBL3-like ubiquitin domain-containing protein n=1 Tax=Mikania micrantha TaxID=192012 RepID=A0A5N6LKX7_9ASTR|nr:hypothetical protein E3N88_42115 [Mikania micrantha]
MKWLISSGIHDLDVFASNVLSNYRLFQLQQPVLKIWKKRCIMAEGNEDVELKFRIYDGTDISHGNYASSTTITALKQKLVSDWPQGLK